jgi:flagellar protein FlaG
MDISMNTSSVVTTTNYSAYQPSNTANEVKTTVAADVSPATIKVTATTNANAEVAVKKEPTVEELKTLVNEGNAMFKNVGSSLEFNVDDSIGQVVVKIIDSKTNEVIRQIPTVDMVNFIRHMKELEKKAGALLQLVV